MANAAHAAAHAEPPTDPSSIAIVPPTVGRTAQVGSTARAVPPVGIVALVEPQRSLMADPYGFLDAEPDFAWRSADGRREFVTTVDTVVAPEWLRRSQRARQRAFLVNAVSWTITAVVLVGVVCIAGMVMVGGDRFVPALRELTGFDVAGRTSAPASPVESRAMPDAQPAAQPSAVPSAEPGAVVRSLRASETH